MNFLLPFILLFAVTGTSAANLTSPDGDTVQIADRPPKVFILTERWVFNCIDTQPQTTMYVCRYYDNRELEKL